MDSVVDVFVRGHYRTTFSWDAPHATPDAEGLLTALRASLHLVDPRAVQEAGTGASLRARTLRGRALFDLGRRQEALGLFAVGAGDPHELVAALGLCTPEPDPACAPAIRAASELLGRAAVPGDLRPALVRAELAAGDQAAAAALLDVGLVLNPTDPALLALKGAPGVSSHTGE